MTLLASLKQRLVGRIRLGDGIEKERGTSKEDDQIAGRTERKIIMYITPQTRKVEASGPRTMLGSAPKSKYPFCIAYKLPFIAFPIRD